MLGKKKYPKKGTKEPLNESERGEWKSWLKTQRQKTKGSLSLLQIHRKNNRMVNKVYKTTSDR